MQITIQARGILATACQCAHVEQRLRFALSRFQDRVTAADVHLSDFLAARGRRDIQCQLRVQLRGLADVLVMDADVDLEAAVDRATARVERSLGYLRRTQRGPGSRLAQSLDAQLG